MVVHGDVDNVPIINNAINLMYYVLFFYTLCVATF